jgi:ribonuclease R
LKRSRGTVFGTLKVGRGGPAFVIPDDGTPEILLMRGGRLEALAGDRVEVSAKQTRWGLRGRILNVVEARRCRSLGMLEKAGRGFCVSLDRSDLPPWLNVEKASLRGAEVGDRVWVELQRDSALAPTHNCRILEILGKGDDPALDFRAVSLEFGLPDCFPEAVLDEAASLSSRMIPRAEREDFRDDLAFTIDPEDAKDHDDALSFRKGPRGTVEVGVHIADVSHFVPEGAEIDLEARSRGTSVYMCDGVVPMLPPKLSENLCSLLPDRNRSTLSVVFEMDREAGIRSYKIVQGLIKSRARLTYMTAEAIRNGEGAADGLKEALRGLAELAGALAVRRSARGSLDLELPETKVLLDEKRVPVDLQREKRLTSHRIVEEFMLLANETVAAEASKRGIPFIYRVHPAPLREKLEELSLQLGELGVRLKPGAVTKGRHLEAVINSAPDVRRRALVSYLVLRAMERARYTASPSEHFGLASECYCQFTSPIRRYPDLFNHRMLKVKLFGDPSGVRRSDPEKVSLQCSETENVAARAERESVRIKCVRFMESRLGERYKGIVTGVTARGYMVELDRYPVEGFAPTPPRPRGRRSKGGLYLGDRVMVAIVRANPLMRELEFAVIKNGR